MNICLESKRFIAKREMVVSPDSLEKWENDRVIPKIEPVKAMAITYGCPELIKRRLDAIELVRKRKAACGQTQTTLRAKQIKLTKL